MSQHRHDYTTQIDTEDRRVYQTIHNNGEKTRVICERVAEDDEHGENFRVTAVDLDPDGTELAETEIGYASAAEYAKEAAKQWMATNPKGVAPNGGGGLLGGGSPW